MITTFRTMCLLSLIVGLLYPLTVFEIGQTVFGPQANGSILYQNTQAVGSLLIGQEFVSERYFWSRPSAIHYNPISSGASNLSPAYKSLRSEIDTRKATIMKTHSKAPIPADLLMTSGSGLDPHISPEAANYQAPRIAKVRRQPLSKIQRLIEEHTLRPTWEILGQARVNVLALNLALDHQDLR